MPLKKLTLTVEADVIERARRYSEANGTSISQLVNSYLARIGDGSDRPYPPAVRRLIGILPAAVDDRADYHRRLEEKYGQ